MAFQFPNHNQEAGKATVDGQSTYAGYTPSSDLVQRLEQLQSVLGAKQEVGVSHFVSEPNLAGWIECMIEELQSNAGAAQQQSPVTEESPYNNNVEVNSSLDSSVDTTGSPPQLPHVQYQDNNSINYKVSDIVVPYNMPRSDVKSTPQLLHAGRTASGGPQPSDSNGRGESSNMVREQPSVGEDESSGVQLVHSLLACAEAVQRGNLHLAEETLRRIQMLGSPPGPMRKVAAHFVEALARRIYGVGAQDSSMGMNQTDSLFELLHFHFYETCPYLKFAHFTANQAILEAFEGQKQVHVIDFNLMHGLQWPALIQALALRPGGPPCLRLTGIGPPQPGRNDVLQEIGMKLAQLAESVHVEFNFRGVVAMKLDDVKPWMLQVRPGEAVAVNSVLQLHRLLYSDGPVAAIDEVLQSVRSLQPKILTIVEHEANHNSPSFLSRFTEALHYYSTMFDSLEACSLQPQSSEQMLAEMYLGREICNIVACEGVARVERHENLSQWRPRMAKAGYRPLQLGLNAFKQASMLLSLFSGDGYRVEETMGCLTLGWHTRPLIAASAWQI